MQGRAMTRYLFHAASLAISCAVAFGFQAPSANPARELVNKYCVSCHNEKLKTAGLVLDRPALDRISNSEETWEKVIAKLRSRAMPPPKLPRPDNATYDQVAAWLESEIDRAAAAHLNPGHPASLHRLNRAEYANAVRDLIAVDVDPQAMLPPDQQAFGFENNAEALSMQPALLDRYVSAATAIARRAVGDSTIPAGVRALRRIEGQRQRPDLSSPGGPSGRRLSAGIQRRRRRAPLFSGGRRLCFQDSSAAGVG